MKPQYKPKGQQFSHFFFFFFLDLAAVSQLFVFCKAESNAADQAQRIMTKASDQIHLFTEQFVRFKKKKKFVNFF